MSVRRIALIGFGHVAERGHLPGWRERDDFEIVAVADANSERRALASRLLPAARLYEDLEALLARETLDVVDIATPPVLHAPLIAKAAAAGCHVLCEKPLATSVADYRAAREAVNAAGVTLFTVHNWKHSAQFMRLGVLLGKGSIGCLKQVRLEVIRSGHAVTVGSEWRSDANQAGGGILIDHGWHALYLLLSLALEQPQRIGAAVERRRYTAANVEDTAS